MLSLIALSLLLAQVLIAGMGVAAVGIDWVKDTLPDCWQDCLGDTKEECNSSDCICDASQNESYLRDAVPCIHDECEVGEFRMQVALLGPLQITCKAAGNPIPSPILSSAYAAIASATATGEASKTSSDAGYATKPTPHQSAKSSSTVSTRKTDTGSLETRPTASSAPSSALASPSSSEGASAPAAPTPEQNAPSAGPSTTLSTTSPSNQDIQEDGQLLSNTNEAGLSHRVFSLSATLLVVVAGILLQS